MKIILQTNLNSPLRLFANFLRWGLWDKPRVRKKIDGMHMKRTYQEHQLGCRCEGHRHRQTRLKGISRQSWSEETFDCVSLFFKQKSVRKSIFIPYWCTSLDIFVFFVVLFFFKQSLNGHDALLLRCSGFIKTWFSSICPTWSYWRMS